MELGIDRHSKFNDSESDRGQKKKKKKFLFEGSPGSSAAMAGQPHLISDRLWELNQLLLLLQIQRIQHFQWTS